MLCLILSLVESDSNDLNIFINTNSLIYYNGLSS